MISSSVFKLLYEFLKCILSIAMETKFALNYSKRQAMFYILISRREAATSSQQEKK